MIECVVKRTAMAVLGLSLLGPSLLAAPQQVWVVQQGTTYPFPPGVHLNAIQPVINYLAADGDIIEVRSAVGSPVETTYQEQLIFPDDRDMKIRAVPAPGTVIRLDGNGLGSTVMFNADPLTGGSITASTELEGFVIRGGTGTLDPGHPDVAIPLCGGGIFCVNATPTIRNCVIEHNTAEVGGGVYVRFDDPNLVEGAPSTGDGPLLDSCLITLNEAKSGVDGFGWGGGLYSILCSPVLEHCVLESNLAHQDGGGALVEGDPSGSPSTLGQVNVVFEDCSISDNFALGNGGGLAGHSGSSTSMTHCTVDLNAADSGGGIACESSRVSLFVTVVGYNSATSSGGGLYWLTDDARIPSLLRHCTIYHNTAGPAEWANGGGAYLSNQQAGITKRPSFENCLVVSNDAGDGGGVYLDFHAATFENCTIADNSARGGNLGGGLVITNPPVSSLTRVLNSIIHGNLAGATAPPPIKPWDQNVLDLTGPPGVSNLMVNYSLVENAGTGRGAPFFRNGTGNLDTRPGFTAGTTWTYFPDGLYYLKHTPQQGATSPCYDAGSKWVTLTPVVQMSCRTAFTISDQFMVDMGFHYPSVDTGLPPGF